MGSIGEHKQYLQQGNFENLDEFDEQVLNDNNLQDSAKTPPSEKVRITRTTLNTLQNHINSATTVQEADQVEQEISNTLNEASNYHEELQELLLQARRLQVELRKR